VGRVIARVPGVLVRGNLERTRGFGLPARATGPPLGRGVAEASHRPQPVTHKDSREEHPRSLVWDSVRSYPAR
jgi:hypothetical protein